MEDPDELGGVEVAAEAAGVSQSHVLSLSVRQEEEEEEEVADDVELHDGDDVGDNESAALAAPFRRLLIVAVGFFARFIRPISSISPAPLVAHPFSFVRPIPSKSGVAVSSMRPLGLMPARF